MFRNTFVPRDDPSFIRQVGGWETHPELKRLLDASEISMKMHFRKPRVSYFRQELYQEMPRNYSPSLVRDLEFGIALLIVQ